MVPILKALLDILKHGKSTRVPIALILLSLLLGISFAYTQQPPIHVVVGLFIVGLASLDTVRRRSRLRKPEALYIRNKHLVGRDGDVTDLVQEIKDWRLIWLVGQSGAGKSAVVERGVVEKLRNDPTFIPIYVSTWGADWVRGPQTALAHALFRALSDEERSLCGMANRPPAPEASLAALENLKLIGREPVLLFDQFDDYQTRHRKEFVRRKRILNVKRLCEANPFWKGLRDLLSKESVRCLFATRDDAAIGLESVRFDEPRTFELTLLPNTFAEELLERITEENGVIEYPKNGWSQLKRRIHRDLGSDGRVLPIQMKRVFESLTTLAYLTVRNYEQAGGLTGVEAQYIDQQLHEIAKTAGWDPPVLLTLLLAMVDRESEKTVMLTESEILGQLPSHLSSDPIRLISVLEQLVMKELLREVLDEDSRQRAWRLDHDYLRFAVLELDRREQEATRFLEGAHENFRTAPGWWSRFKVLLQPREQIWLAIQRLRGRLTYGQAAAYVRLSTIRLVLNGWMVLALLGIYGFGAYRVQQAQTEARALFNEFVSLDYGDRITASTAAALWSLSGKPLRIKGAFLEKGFSHLNNVLRLNMSQEFIATALTGLNRSTGETLAWQLLGLPSCLEKTGVSHILASCAEMVGLLQDYQRMPVNRLGELAERLVSKMMTEEHSDRLASLAEGLRALGERVPPEKIGQGAERLISKIMTEEPIRLARLAGGLGALGKRVPPDKAGELAERLVSKMMTEEDSNRLASLAGGLDVAAHQHKWPGPQ